MQYKIVIKNNSHQKYLFLDIDGVLNDHSIYDKLGIDHHHTKNFILQKEKINLLNQIVEKYNPIIILSSYWRKKYSIKKINKIFKKNGFIGHISDKTTNKGKEHDDRWNQIKKYITKNNIKNFIILDDLHLTKHHDSIVPNLIKPNSNVGILPKHLEQINNIWN